MLRCALQAVLTLHCLAFERRVDILSCKRVEEEKTARGS